MTTRRSFLRNLVAALVLAPVVAKFAEVMPAVAESAAPVAMALNPAYEAAEFEQAIIWHPDAMMSEWEKAEAEAGILGVFPPRFTLVGGQYVRVKPTL